MKNVSKFITFLILSVFTAQTALAASVYIPPSKTKPDISRLKADPGCKYIVEYNEFVSEYSVNHICDTWQAFNMPKNTHTTVNAPTIPAVIQPVVVPVVQQAPSYPVYVNSVSNNYSIPSWGFALPSFSNWFTGFSSWFYEPVAYDIEVVEPVYEVEEVSWYESLPTFDFDYSSPQTFNFDYSAPTNFNFEETPASTFQFEQTPQTTFQFDF